MTAGYSGTFIISWAQTELDGAVGAPLAALVPGAHWRWSGEAIRVDGHAAIPGDGTASGLEDLRRRAALSVRRLLGAAIAPRGAGPVTELAREVEDVASFPANGFIVTDGRDSFVIDVIRVPDTEAHLLMFVGVVPPQATDLWVVERMFEVAPPRDDSPGAGVICFTPGTLIDTPHGQRPIEQIGVGDQVNTKDDGAQEILWIGRRRVSGARMFAMPHLRPIRIQADALGRGRPMPDLLVSPQHRMLVRSDAARALFNEPEVLVAASDLIDDQRICVECGLREVVYIHLLTARHQVVWANGLETESFHPGNTSLQAIAEAQRLALLDLLPGLERDAMGYGGFARRNLTASEAAILRHEGA